MASQYCYGLVIIDNLHFCRATIGPMKADPALIINSYTMLPFSIALQPLEAVTWRKSKVLKACRGIYHVQLACCNLPQIAR